MSADNVEALPSPQRRSHHRRHGRKRSLSRRWRKSTTARRFGQGIGVFFLGILIVVASLFAAQRFAEYKPPVQSAE